MRLSKIHITNFRCIEDSEEFDLSPLTCLVGKNESGKTAVLQAIHRLRPHADAEYDIDRDYPRRHLSDYAQRHPSGRAKVLSTVWEVEDPDRKALVAALGPAGDAIKTAEVTASYGSASKTWAVSIEDEPVIRHILARSNLHEEEVKSLGSPRNIAELKKAIGDGTQSERHAALLQTIGRDFKRNDVTLAAIDLLNSRLPTFLYFSQYDRMLGRVSLDEVSKKVKEEASLTEGERLFVAFCEFAGSSLDELTSIDTFERLKAKFEGASNKITDKIFEYWTQNQFLSVQFSSDAALPGDPPPFNAGRVFNVRVSNELHGVTVPFDERSAGFVWFFSFLVSFSQVARQYDNNVIILLDEPGLNLHGKAQEDLLRYIREELVPYHQVIYTTHSPFLVPADDLLSVRTVEDVLTEKRGQRRPTVHGTKVRKNPLDARGDTLFPLLGALGFEITQSLFVGKNTLIVEGPSDLLYLKVYSRQLAEAKRTGLDPNWVICPVGGVDKVPAFLALFGANKLNVAALLDLAKGTKGKVARTRQLAEEILKAGAVFDCAGVAERKEADVEDIIGFEGYVDLVNACYGLDPALKPPSPETTRVLEFVEAEMRTRADFDHFTPAEYLTEHRTSVLPKLTGASDALDRFEKLFKALNQLLKK